jgi:hypothetical protein
VVVVVVVVVVGGEGQKQLPGTKVRKVVPHTTSKTQTTPVTTTLLVTKHMFLYEMI